MPKVLDCGIFRFSVCTNPISISFVPLVTTGPVLCVWQILEKVGYEAQSRSRWVKISYFCLQNQTKGDRYRIFKGISVYSLFFGPCILTFTFSFWARIGYEYINGITDYMYVCLFVRNSRFSTYSLNQEYKRTGRKKITRVKEYDSKGLQVCHTAPWLFEGTWWRSFRVIHSFRFYLARDQSPGHKRLFEPYSWFLNTESGSKESWL